MRLGQARRRCCLNVQSRLGTISAEQQATNRNRLTGDTQGGHLGFYTFPPHLPTWVFFPPDLPGRGTSHQVPGTHKKPWTTTVCLGPQQGGHQYRRHVHGARHRTWAAGPPSRSCPRATAGDGVHLNHARHRVGFTPCVPGLMLFSIRFPQTPGSWNAGCC